MADVHLSPEDALLVHELLGFRAQFSDSEADGSPLRIRDETGESEQAEANLRAVLKEAADRIKALAAAQARVAELEGERDAARAELRTLARRVLTWFDLGDDRSTFPPQLMADLRALAERRT